LVDELDATGEVDISDLADSTQELSAAELEAEIEDEISDDIDEELDPTGDIDTSALSKDIEADLDEEDEGLSKKEQLIAKLSEKLPFLGKLLGGKKSASDSDEEEDEPEESTKTEIGAMKDLQEEAAEPEWMIKIKEKAPFLAGPLSKIAALQNKNKASSSEEDDEEEGAKPKRKIKVIHIIIVAAVVGVLLIPAEEEPTTTAGTQTPTAKKPVPKKPVTQKPVEKTPPTTPPVEETKPVAETKPAEESVEDDITDGLDLGNIAETPDLTIPKEQEDKEAKTEQSDELDDLFEEEPKPVAQKPVEEKPEEEKPQEISANDSMDSMLEDEKPADAQEVSADNSVDDMLGEDTISEAEDTSMPSTEIDPMDGMTLGEAMEDKLIESNNENTMITTDILEKLEVKTKELREKELLEKASSPTDPPEYINPGSALVYNCSDGHWACVGVSNYQTCNSNYAWNLKQGLKIQCYPSQIYESEEDCIALQQYKIDSVAKTPFCN